MKNIVVVGGAGGVGFALLDMLVRRGDHVRVTVLNADEAERVRTVHGNKVELHELDLGNAERAKEQFSRLIDRSGPIDAVALCAGLLETCPLELTPLATFRKLFEVNCLSVVAIFQSCAPVLRASKGRMVVVSSTAGLSGMPFIGAYVTSKFAVEGVADVIRRETYAQGIFFSVIEPGAIRTSMTSNQLATIRERLNALGPEDRERYGHLYLSYEEMATASWDTTTAKPDEVASTMLEALDAAEPQPRYVVGAQAQEMLNMMKGMSDREVDKLIHEMATGSTRP